MPTGPLSPSPPRFPLDIHPLARLRDGKLELLRADFPPLGRVALMLWRPAGDPPFTIAEGLIHRGWRFEGPDHDAWVVGWVAVGDPAQTS